MNIEFKSTPTSHGNEEKERGKEGGTCIQVGTNISLPQGVRSA